MESIEGPTLGAAARARDVEDVGHPLDEGWAQWMERGVDASTIPELATAIRTVHRRRWPMRVREIAGWTCVVVQCFADLADALGRLLRRGRNSGQLGSRVSVPSAAFSPQTGWRTRR